MGAFLVDTFVMDGYRVDVFEDGDGFKVTLCHPKARKPFASGDVNSDNPSVTRAKARDMIMEVLSSGND